MQLRYIFLVLGLLLSVISKIMQFGFKSKVGDIVVIPAAVFFTLTILLSLKKYVGLLNQPNGTARAVIMAVLACAAVVSFQIMMILLVGHHNKLGFVWVAPFLLAAGVFLYQWIRL